MAFTILAYLKNFNTKAFWSFVEQDKRSLDRDEIS